MKNSYIDIFLEQFEEVLQFLVKKETSERKNLMDFGLKVYIACGKTFTHNLVKYANSKFSQQDDITLQDQLSNSHRDLQSEMSINFDHSNVQQGNNVNIKRKIPKVPMLNIPQNLNYINNYRAQSRSTRRIQPYKSLDTNSQRFINFGLPSSDNRQRLKV